MPAPKRVIELLRQAVAVVHRGSPVRWIEVEDLCRAALVEARRSAQEAAIETLTMTSLRREKRAFLEQTDRIIALLREK